MPPYRETQAYVAKVMALAGGAGALAGGGGDVVLLRAGDRFVVDGVCWHTMKRTTIKLPDELDARSAARGGAVAG